MTSLTAARGAPRPQSPSIFTVQIASAVVQQGAQKLSAVLDKDVVELNRVLMSASCFDWIRALRHRERVAHEQSLAVAVVQHITDNTAVFAVDLAFIVLRSQGCYHGVLKKPQRPSGFDGSVGGGALVGIVGEGFKIALQVLLDGEGDTVPSNVCRPVPTARIG